MTALSDPFMTTRSLNWPLPRIHAVEFIHCKYVNKFLSLLINTYEFCFYIKVLEMVREIFIDNSQSNKRLKEIYSCGTLCLLKFVQNEERFFVKDLL